jgi:hypothetical protein
VAALGGTVDGEEMNAIGESYRSAIRCDGETMW